MADTKWLHDEIDALTARLVTAQTEAGRLRTLNDELLAACKMVRARWSFHQQQHTHTWHDWADCKPVLDAAIAKAETKK